MGKETQANVTYARDGLVLGTHEPRAKLLCQNNPLQSNGVVATIQERMCSEYMAFSGG